MNKYNNPIYVAPDITQVQNKNRIQNIFPEVVRAISRHLDAYFGWTEELLFWINLSVWLTYK